MKSVVARRLDGVHGVRIIDVGCLEVEEAGHDLGTPFALISAHSVLAAEFAETALRELARVSDQIWRSGWDELDGELVLRIFPEL